MVIIKSNGNDDQVMVMIAIVMIMPTLANDGNKPAVMGGSK